MAGIYINFPKSWSQDKIDKFKQAMSRMVSEQGFTTPAGPKSGGGNVREWIEAHLAGEVCDIIVSGEEKAAVLLWLKSALDAARDETLHGGLLAIVDALTFTNHLDRTA